MYVHLIDIRRVRTAWFTPDEAESRPVGRPHSHLVEHFLHIGDDRNCVLSESEKDADEVIQEVGTFQKGVVEAHAFVFGLQVENNSAFSRFVRVEDGMMRTIPSSSIWPSVNFFLRQFTCVFQVDVGVDD